MDRKIDEKLDKISDKIANIDVTLAKQEVSIAEHIKRTAQLEDRIEPVEHAMFKISGALNLIKWLIGFTAVAECIFRYVEVMRSVK